MEKYSTEAEKVDAGQKLAQPAPAAPAFVYDKKAEDKLRLKIDLFVVPTVALLYLFCFIDRANIGNARLAGFEKDLGMSGYDYNIVLTSFYVPYAVMEIPSNLCCKYFGPGRWLPFISFMFGICSMATAFVKNRAQMIAVRFFLGVFEAGMLPGIAYYLSRWYRRAELGFRLALYLVTAPLAGAFGGLLASAILKLDGIGSVHSWQQIFLIEGIITIGLSAMAFFTLTDRPSTARWMSEEEKELAVKRVASENIATADYLDKIHKKKIYNGIFNPNTLAVGWIFLLDNITVQGLAFFLPTIVRTIYPTKTVIEQQLYTVPPYVVGATVNLIMPFLSWRFDNRIFTFLTSAPLMMIGYVIFLATTNPHARYGGTFLIASGSFVFGAMSNAHVSANVLSDTARSAAIGANVMFGNLGGIVSTWAFLPFDAPNYHIGNGLNFATSSIIWITSFGLLFWQIRDNRRRDRREAAVPAGQVLQEMDGQKIEDLEWRHPSFRWKY